MKFVPHPTILYKRVFLAGFNLAIIAVVNSSQPAKTIVRTKEQTVQCFEFYARKPKRHIIPRFIRVAAVNLVQLLKILGLSWRSMSSPIIHVLVGLGK